MDQAVCELIAHNELSSDVFERLEEAMAPSRELDRLIHQQASLHLVSDETFIDGIGNPNNKRVLTYRKSRLLFCWFAPRYTESVEIAASLVPWWLRRSLMVQFSSPAKAGFERDGRMTYFEAATPALAVSLAGLKAQSAGRQHS